MITIFMYAITDIGFNVKDMRFGYIVKPYKTFIKAALRLCALFSFLVFISFTPLIKLALVPVWLLMFYITNIFIDFCVKFGYKKIMLVIVFAALFLSCLFAASGLRNFVFVLYFGY